MPSRSSAIGTYSTKLPWTRIALPSCLSPPSKKSIFFLTRSTVTRMLTPTSIRARNPVKMVVIGIGNALMACLLCKSNADPDSPSLQDSEQIVMRVGEGREVGALLDLLGRLGEARPLEQPPVAR